MKKRAFTLFELLVSISIIGILIAVASMSYGGAQKKTRDARRMEDMNAIQKAMEMYYSQNNGSYPGSIATSALVPNYLQAWPKNPKGSTYSFRDTTTTSYCICAELDIPATGNSQSNYCFTYTGSLNWYCVKNQQ